MSAEYGSSLEAIPAAIITTGCIMFHLDSMGGKFIRLAKSGEERQEAVRSCFVSLFAHLFLYK
jgi:hypothetical protein